MDGLTDINIICLCYKTRNWYLCQLADKYVSSIPVKENFAELSFLFLSYSCPIPILFLSYSYPFPILFISYSCPIPILLLSYFYPIPILFLTYSYSIHVLFYARFLVLKVVNFDHQRELWTNPTNVFFTNHYTIRRCIYLLGT